MKNKNLSDNRQCTASLYEGLKLPEYAQAVRNSDYPKELAYSYSLRLHAFCFPECFATALVSIN